MQSNCTLIHSHVSVCIFPKFAIHTPPLPFTHSAIHASPVPFTHHLYHSHTTSTIHTSPLPFTHHLYHSHTTSTIHTPPLPFTHHLYHSHITCTIHTPPLPFTHHLYHSHTTSTIHTSPLPFTHHIFHSHSHITSAIHTPPLPFIHQIYHSHTTSVIYTHHLPFTHNISAIHTCPFFWSSPTLTCDTDVEVGLSCRLGVDPEEGGAVDGHLTDTFTMNRHTTGVQDGHSDGADWSRAERAAHMNYERNWEQLKTRNLEQPDVVKRPPYQSSDAFSEHLNISTGVQDWNFDGKDQIMMIYCNILYKITFMVNDNSTSVCSMQLCYLWLRSNRTIQFI